MKIICTQENLKAGLQTAGRIITGSNTLPILNNILLKTENGQLKISATNLEIAISTLIRCKIEEEGEVCVPAKIITELIQSLPSSPVVLENTKDGIEVKTDRYFTTLKTLPSEEFPLIPTIDKEIRIIISAEVLKSGIDQVIFAASTSETQPEISGMLLKLEKSSIKFVATDRYRLGEKTISLANQSLQREIIIPQKAIIEVSRVLANQTGDVTILLNDNQIAVNLEETQIISRLIDGQYPDYTQIIPEDFQTTAVVNKQEFASALKTSGIFSHATNSINVAYDSDLQVVKISSLSQDLGESVVEISSKIQGQSGSIMFNYRYILDTLNTIKEEEIVIYIVDDSAPVVLKPNGNKDYVYLVMPIKV